jgi:hypothetical protein
MMALYIIIPIAALLVFLGCITRFKKAYWLISGYNTMPPEKQANIDVEKMGKVISNCLFVCAALLVAGGVCLYLSLGLPGFICLLAILPICLTAVALTGKYNHNPADQKSRLRIIIPTAIVVVVLFIVMNMLLSGSQPTQYSLSNGALTISTMYGETVNLSDVKSVELKDTVPGNLIKTDGFDLSTVLKGHFKSGSTEYTLFVDTAKPPFIYLDTASGIILLNDQTADQTKALFEKLIAAVK